MIREVVADYQLRFPNKIKYIENPVNLGYDANIRNLIDNAKGEYCFFMGNDDLMCEGSLDHVSDLLDRYSNVGMVLKSYAWFDGVPSNINQEVRYFIEERFFPAGRDAISVCFRRSGVISGFLIKTDAAKNVATEKFDGGLYYQMLLSGMVLSKFNAVATPKVLVHCRNGEPPDFGNSQKEKGVFVPGAYTLHARLTMIRSALDIARFVEDTTGICVFEEIRRDYANYFYPYIKDQLNLPISKYSNLYLGYCKMGFWRYPIFHLYIFLCYLLGEKRFDWFTRKVRSILGRTPHIGRAR